MPVAVAAAVTLCRTPTSSLSPNLSGTIFTDAGAAAGIGGCTQLALTNTFVRYTRTFAYEFDARNGPGLVPIPGYVWGAGHASWPTCSPASTTAP